MSTHPLNPLTVQRIAAIDRELSDLRPEADMIKAELAKPRAADDLAEMLGSVLLLIDAFGPGDSGEKAIYIIGRLRGVLTGFARRTELLNRVEQLRDRRRKLEHPGE